MDILLTLDRAELRLTAADYMDRTNQTSGICGVRVSFVDDAVVHLPASIWSRFCLLLDYENLRIGFSERLYHE